MLVRQVYHLHSTPTLNVGLCRNNRPNGSSLFELVCFGHPHIEPVFERLCVCNGHELTLASFELRSSAAALVLVVGRSFMCSPLEFHI